MKEYDYDVSEDCYGDTVITRSDGAYAGIVDDCRVEDDGRLWSKSAECFVDELSPEMQNQRYFVYIHASGSEDEYEEMGGFASAELAAEEAIDELSGISPIEEE
jgi:hypothetical protein